MPRLRWLVAFVLTTVPLATRAHSLLDPDGLQQALARIARADAQARADAADPEAFYVLGAEVASVLELLSQDVAVHGTQAPLARLFVERLRSYGLDVSFSEVEHRYAYDQAAFRVYLVRAPAGLHAADVRYALLARGFQGRVGPDPSSLDHTDVPVVEKAVAEEEEFLRQYPSDNRVKEVRFFLAVDRYRLARAEQPSRRRQSERLGREALERVRTEYPGTMEARAAERLLEMLTPR